MRKKLFIIYSAAATACTMFAFNLGFLFYGNWKLIAAVYAAVMLIMSGTYFILDRHFKKHGSSTNETVAEKLLENVNAMVILWKPDMSFVSVNPNLIKTTGFSEEACNHRFTLKKLLPPEAFSQDGRRKLLSNGEYMKEVRCADGNVRSILWNTSVLKKKNSSSLMMSIGIDVTDQQDMKKKLLDYSKSLEEAQNRYHSSMELSEIGVFLIRSNKSICFVSEHLQHMLGFDSEEVSLSVLRERIHPHDRVLYDTCAQQLAHSVQLDSIRKIELRILSADQCYHWYSFRYKISEHSDGTRELGGALFDIMADREKDSLIEKMAYVDEITQIYNRNKFMDIGQETYQCSKDLGVKYWVIVLDIDKFHVINDTCGYQNGNILLKSIAITILRNMTPGGFGARVGGDNFAMLIKDDGNPNLPLETIQSIQSELALLATDVFANQTISCSAGYCSMPDDGKDFSEILEHAEFALRMDDNTRGTAFCYDRKTHQSFITDNIIEKELQTALDRHEFVLYYQPKINLSNGSVIGVEALIRWKKPDGTIIPPGLFIPVAEKSFLITKISDFVLSEACRQNKEWQNEGLPPLTVSINLTSVDFYQTDVKESIRKALLGTGLSPEYLEVELTESLALKDVEQAIHQMKELKQLGVKLSMDDFGTGYSSLSYIQVLPITLLKLDRSFIMYLEEDEVSREIVSAVIKIAKSKKIETIAEGIETSGQAEILRASGCDHAQGFFFGMPMPADEFREFLKNKSQNTKTQTQEGFL